MSLIYASVNKFWDRVPIGRILNVLGKNVTKTEFSLATKIDSCVTVVIEIIKVLIMVSFTSSPLLLICVFIQFWASWRLLNYVRKAKLDISRVQSRINSPINQIYTEALRGLTEIRVFGKEEEILKEFYDKVDQKRSQQQITMATNIYTNTRFAFLSQLSTIPGFIAVLYIQPSSGMIALLIRNLLDISNTLNLGFRKFNLTETNFVSFAKCLQFTEIQPETGYNDISKTIDNFNKNQPIHEDNNGSSKNDLIWPNKGELTFKNVSVKYRPELNNVLTDLSFNIKGGEKIGIVGRTGAGKTTLISSIQRNFETYEGSIKLDSKEIKKVDLKTLRNGITIIPQDPHLFNDTLKNNLDPLNKFTNEDVEQIQNSLEIMDKFEDKGGIHFEISDDGKNLSQGEKQLQCMARALLNKKKLILMDEATANIDVVTEEKIQKAIETFFKDSTLIIIAHRLSTIMFCDKIMVLDQGEKAEFDTLEDLKNDENSVFGKMVAMNNDIQNFMK